MRSTVQFWVEFLHVVVYMNRTIIGSLLLFVTLIGWLAGFPNFTMVSSAIGGTYMVFMTTLVFAVPFSSAITEQNWRPVKRTIEKMNAGQEPSVDEVRRIEVEVYKKGLPFTSTLSFVIMLLLSDLSTYRSLRIGYRIMSIALVSIGVIPLVLIGKVYFAAAWFSYHVAIDLVTFRSVSKIQNEEKKIVAEGAQ